MFRRSCASFIINKDNKFIQKRKYRNLFDGKIYSDNFLIITLKEFESVIKTVHNKNSHSYI